MFEVDVDRILFQVVVVLQLVATRRRRRRRHQGIHIRRNLFSKLCCCCCVPINERATFVKLANKALEPILQHVHAFFVGAVVRHHLLVHKVNSTFIKARPVREKN